MSDGQTNPTTEVEKPQPQSQLNMLDVMFGSEESTNPEQTSEPAQPEAEEVEAVEAEVEAQAEVEAEAPEELPAEVEEQYEVEEVEATEETKEPSYRVKVDGEEYEVTLDELRNGYQRQSDYTRKSQSLAEQRKAFEANLQAVQSERQQYGQILDKVTDHQDLEVTRLSNIDWSSLKESDPMKYMEQRLELQEAREKSSALKQEQVRINSQNQKEFQHQLSEVLEKESAKLGEVLPDYVNPNNDLKKRLREYALESGFSEQDVNSIADHKVVLVLYKAMLQDESKRGTVRKISKKVPRVVKAGTPESKSQKGKRGLKEKRDRLRKTGHPRDAANVFLDMI